MPSQAPSVDEELLAWQRERRRHHGMRLPWQQLLLVASLSFFIASFVLPASINAGVNWLLDLLTAASALAWFHGRRKRARELPSEPHG